MTSIIDRVFFQELSERNPREVCRRSLCSYNDTHKSYSISLWGYPCIVRPHQFKVEHVDETSEGFHPYLSLFAVHYLLNAKEIEPAGQWISEKDLPGGATFFRGPHEIPTNLITAQFNSDLEGFNEKCEQLMGKPLSLADTAYAFEIAPRIPVAVLYWAGDDEFPAESKVLYDKTIAEHLSLDIVYALAVGICERIGKPTG